MKGGIILDRHSNGFIFHRSLRRHSLLNFLIPIIYYDAIQPIDLVEHNNYHGILHIT